jgi:hypothetical protein
MNALEKTISKALARTQGMAPREQWSAIQAQVEVLFDILDDGPVGQTAGAVLAAVKQQHSPLLVMPSADEARHFGAPVAPPVRIISPGGAAMNDAPEMPVEHWLSLDSLVEEVKRVMPATIALDLPGFDRPLQLQRRVTPGPPVTEGVKFCRLQYLAEGSPDGPSVLCKTSDETVDVAALLGEIQAGAAAQFSPTQRKVTPNTAYVRPPSLDELRSMMPARDPGPGKDEECDAKSRIATDQRTWDRYAK